MAFCLVSVPVKFTHLVPVGTVIDWQKPSVSTYEIAPHLNVSFFLFLATFLFSTNMS